MTQIAQGIVHASLPWPMLWLGGLIGLGAVALEVVLKRRGLSFPALTVGIGMYLPLSVEMTIGLGGILGFLCERALRRRAPDALEPSRRRGVLIASGLLVGESFVGVGLAAVDATSAAPGPSPSPPPCRRGPRRGSASPSSPSASAPSPPPCCAGRPPQIDVGDSRAGR